MKKFIILTTALLLLVIVLKGQNNRSIGITGKLVDTTGVSLPSATIVLVQAIDSVMQSFTISNEDGNFTFKKIPEGNYILQISYLGYRNMSKAITVQSEGETMDLGEIILDQQNLFLDEVEIEVARIPIIIKQDTIEYNADSFKTSPNAMVEDLLKKLPGIEVDREGNVKAQGEAVRKVLVDGKEFFSNDPKIATKNLPADAVDKVQVFDKMSEMSEFTGIDDGNREKTINLALKDDKKKGYFGTVGGGYGTDDRYEGKLSVNRFTDNLQLSVLGSSNNTNQHSFSFMDYINFMGGLQSMSGGGGSVSLQMDAIGGMGGMGGAGSNGINTTFSGGVNLNYDLSEKTEISSSYFYNSVENDLQQEVFRQNFLESGSYVSESFSDQISKNTNHRLNFKLKQTINDFQDLSLRTNLSFSDGSLSSFEENNTFGISGILENQGIAGNLSFGDNLRFNSDLIYRRKFKKTGRSLVLNTRINKSDDNKDRRLDALNSFLPGDPLLGFTETIMQNQVQTNDQLNYGITLSYTEPLGKKRYLEFSYAHQNNNNDLDKDFFDIMPDGQRIFNDVLSNLYKRRYTYNRGGAKLLINKPGATITAGLNVQSSILNGRIISEGNEINKDFLTVLPSLRWKINFSTSNHMNITYSTNLREPSLEQLQPIVDNSNPLSAYVGNPDLKAEYTHRFGINYMLFDQFNFTNVFVTFNSSYTQNKITNARTIDSLFRQLTQPVNVDHNFTARGYISFGTPLKFMGAKVNINLSSTYNRGILFVNTVENNTDRWNNSVDLSFENRKKKALDIKFGAKYSFNDTRYSENSNLDQGFTTRIYYSDFSLTILKDWTLNSTFDYTIYQGDAFGSNREVPIWRAFIAKNFLSTKRGQLKLSVYDLLNENVGINRTSELNYIQDQRVNALGRFFMLSLSYSLSAVGNKGIDIDIHHAR